jgi:large subunit ribosomal protein L18
MDNSQKRRKIARKARIMRVRKKVRGTTDKPRLMISKTNQHIYAQLIDDQKGLTLAGVGTMTKEYKKEGKSKEAAEKIGTQIAQMAKKLNVNAIVFDRGRYKFHGIVAQLANAAREAGLQF